MLALELWDHLAPPHFSTRFQVDLHQWKFSLFCSALYNAISHSKVNGFFSVFYIQLPVQKPALKYSSTSKSTDSKYPLIILHPLQVNIILIFRTYTQLKEKPAKGRQGEEIQTLREQMVLDSWCMKPELSPWAPNIPTAQV